MADRFVYVCSPEEIAMAQEHARQSLAPRTCIVCERRYGPNAWMVLSTIGRVCWICHVMKEATNG